MASRMKRPAGNTPPAQSEIMARLAAAASSGEKVINRPVIVMPDKTIQVGGFTIRENTIEVDDLVDANDWIQFVRWLRSLESTIQWGLGDLVKAAEQRKEQWLKSDNPFENIESKYADLLESTGYSYSSLTKFASFADRFPVFRRRKTLDYSHHVEVAHLPLDLQEELLDRAEMEGWSVRLLRLEASGKSESPSPVDDILTDKTQKNRFNKIFRDGAKDPATVDLAEVALFDKWWQDYKQRVKAARK